jgi:hypothetical protein
MGLTFLCTGTLRVGAVEIQVLTVPDCPNRSVILGHLHEALGSLGDPPVTVIERLVTVEEEAQAAGMHGSPTILIDGRDPFVAPGTAASVSCRLFPSNGGLRGAPSVAELAAALSAHLGAGRAGDDCCEGIAIEGADVDGKLHRFGADGFVALWRNERVLASELADDPKIISSLQAAGRVEVDVEGVLLAVHGLAAHPTRHRIEHAGGVVHTWCALDAIGISAALGIDADAVTSCPTCKRELRVRLVQGTPDDMVPALLLLPKVSCDHLLDDFCAHANLYCDRAHLDASTGGRVGRAIGVAEVAAIGRRTWADVARVLA